MNDFRVTTDEQFREVLKAAEASTPPVDYPACMRGLVRGPMPEDRRGLLAVMHDQCMRTDEQMARHHLLAMELAKQTGQRVYMVYTTGRWHLLLLAIEVTTSVGVEGVEGKLWYDDMPGGVYANDQHISHVNPDGTYDVDGAS